VAVFFQGNHFISDFSQRKGERRRSDNGRVAPDASGRPPARSDTASVCHAQVASIRVARLPWDPGESHAVPARMPQASLRRRRRSGWCSVTVGLGSNSRRSFCPNCDGYSDRQASTYNPQRIFQHHPSHIASRRAQPVTACRRSQSAWTQPSLTKCSSDPQAFPGGLPRLRND
jgi:hypothetical protein